MLAALLKHFLRPDPFAAEIAAFRAAGPLPPGAILFAGSSSIRMWTSLDADMAPFCVVNRGFGGSSIPDVTRHFSDVARLPDPRAIVFYAGDNDLESRRPPARIVADFEHFMRLKERRFGALPVFFVSIKPAPARAHYRAAREAVNSMIRQRALSRADLLYVDIAQPMLAADRLDDLFLPDGIHLSAAGYVVWRAAILDALFAVFPEARPIV
jgi:lysophospholipase L1-like esterase